MQSLCLKGTYLHKSNLIIYFGGMLGAAVEHWTTALDNGNDVDIRYLLCSTPVFTIQLQIEIRHAGIMPK